ncbi:MAG: hypothetical protein GY750_13835 [Lentisphaerae bacterium]|nr:hypothetical protein [Lentisphaerota bacterium]
MKNSETTNKRRSFWQTHVEAHRISGLTQKEYCLQNNISYWSFNSWKCKMKDRDHELQEVSPEIVQGLSSDGKQIKVILDNHITISIPQGFSEETLCKILHIFGVK